MGRRARLIALGGGIGAIAAALVLVPLSALMYLVSLAGANPPLPARSIAAILVATVVAGAVAGFLASFWPARLPEQFEEPERAQQNKREEARALVVCGGAAFAWSGLASALALWPPLTAAVRDAPTLGRAVWEGGRRVAAFGTGLFAALLAAPLTLVAGMSVVALALGRVELQYLGAIALVLAGWGLALGGSILALHWAGVPRRLPGRDATPRVPGGT